VPRTAEPIDLLGLGWATRGVDGPVCIIELCDTARSLRVCCPLVSSDTLSIVSAYCAVLGPASNTAVVPGIGLNDQFALALGPSKTIVLPSALGKLPPPLAR